MTEPKSLWEDLKQRRVFRSVLLYAILGWGAFQVTESVTPVLDLPDWLPRLVLYLLLLGFPIVSGLAWAFDVTTTGVKSAAPGGGRGRLPDHRSWNSPNGSSTAWCCARGSSPVALKTGS